MAENSRIYYPLTDLLLEARREAPAGRTFAVKRADLHEHAGYDTADFRILDADPQAYLLGAQKRAGGLAVSRLTVFADTAGHEPVATYGIATVRKQSAITGKPETLRYSRQVTAVRIHGRAMLPEEQSAVVIGAFVPNEPSTGFLHAVDSEGVANLAELFTTQSLMPQLQ